MITAFAANGPKTELIRFEYEPNELNDDQVEIDVNFCGLSRRDLNMIDNTWGKSQYPLVPGHEVIGRIVKVGRSVKRLSLGQLVGLGWPRLASRLLSSVSGLYWWLSTPLF